MAFASETIENAQITLDLDSGLWAVVHCQAEKLDPWFARSKEEAVILARIMSQLGIGGTRVALSMHDISEATETVLQLSIDNKTRLIQYLHEQRISQ